MKDSMKGRDFGESDRSGGCADDAGSDELARALNAIEGLRLRIAESERPILEDQVRRMAMALSMIDAALAETVRELHLAAARDD